jgi:hypothetical protein
MKRIVFFTGLLVCFAAIAESQTKIIGLPKEAVIIETKNLRSSNHPNRSLVLWMLKPKRNPSNIPDDESYTCPDETRGSSYDGPTRVSLVDTSTNTVINTVKILKDYEEPADTFNLPYAIRSGYYYYSPKPARAGAQTRPTILLLRDYNGDGKALEFALFDALACMGLQTTLIGYSERQDRVIHFPINLTVVESGKSSEQSLHWADYLFSKQPQRPSYWEYEIDYRGRGGSLDKWQVQYDRSKEQFEAKLTVSNTEP